VRSDKFSNGTYLLIGLILAGLVSAGFAIGYALGVGRGGVVDEALSAIAAESRNAVSVETLQRAAIEGMLRAAGDGYGEFFQPDEQRGFTPGTAGNFTGVGIWLGTDAEDRPIVGGVFSDSPAAQAGVKAGDILLAIDDQRVANLDSNTIAGMLRGEDGSAVNLRIERGKNEQVFSVTRRSQLASALNVAKLKGGVTYLQPGPLVEGVANGSGKALQSAAGKGVLLDLRGNPGGLIDEGVAFASLFLEGGPVAIYKERGQAPITLQAPFKGDGATPLVVLVDRDTASSAEVVAAALQSRNRAVLVGSRTRGKAAVQELVPLANSSALQQTIGEYRSPTDERVDGVGIEPDVKLPVTSDSDSALRQALSVLRGLMQARSTLAP
jgi:carboxyl-terminal processing protease